MRVAVRRLHAAGIEVILDVVYNHTAESDETRPDAVVPRPRQRQLLSTGGRRPAPHRQRHRHRQHGESVASARAADGDGLAALLGDLVPRRRVPLRSLRDARPRAERLRSGRRLLRRAAPGSGARRREADRRAVGHRSGRLSARQPSARLCRMERPVPRCACGASGAAIAGQRPEIAARLAGSADIFARHGRRPWASINFVAAHDGFTLRGRRELRRASQRGERRRATATAIPPTSPATGASRGRPTTQRSTRCATG